MPSLQFSVRATTPYLKNQKIDLVASVEFSLIYLQKYRSSSIGLARGGGGGQGTWAFPIEMLLMTKM